MPCSTTLGVTFAAVMVFPSIGLIAALMATTILASTDGALGKAVVTDNRVPIHRREAIVNGIPVVGSLVEERHGGVDMVSTRSLVDSRLLHPKAPARANRSNESAIAVANAPLWNHSSVA